MVTPEYFPKNIGGGGVVYRELAMELRKQGHSVTVLAGDFVNSGIMSKPERSCDGEVRIVFLPLLPALKTRGVDTSTYTPPSIPGFVHLTSRLIKASSEVVHLHGLGHPLIDVAAISCILFHRSYVFTCHGIPKSPTSAGIVLRVVFRIYLSLFARFVFRKASLVTVVSRSLLKECNAKGLTNLRIFVIPNGLARCRGEVKPSTVERIEKRYSLKGKKVIFSVGRLLQVKGFQCLIDAMPLVVSKFPDALAVIAGEGPYRETLSILVGETGLSDYIKLVGRLSEEEKWAFYRRADIVVFPSLYEPFGIVALEAMSAGKAVIASDVGGFSEVLKHEKAGFLVRPGNSEEIAKHIIFVMAHDQLRRETERSALSEAELHGWESVGKLYTSALSIACLADHHRAKQPPSS